MYNVNRIIKNVNFNFEVVTSSSESRGCCGVLWFAVVCCGLLWLWFVLDHFPRARRTLSIVICVRRP